MQTYNRMSLSIKNKLVDEDGRPYSIYTNQQLADILNCSLRKVVNIKQELVNLKLLYQVKRGFNRKKWKNEPNILYLCELEVNGSDTYTPSNGSVQEIVSNHFGSARNDKLSTPISEKEANKSSIKSPLTTGKSAQNGDNNITKVSENAGYAQDTLKLNSNLTILKTLIQTINTDNNHSVQNDHDNSIVLNQGLLDNIADTLNHSLESQTILSDHALSMLGKACDDVPMLNKCLSAITSAKRYAERKIALDEPIQTEDAIFPDGFGKTASEKISRDVLSALLRLKTGKVRGDFASYLWGTVKSTFMQFREYQRGQENQRKNPNGGIIPMYQWSEVTC
ncbi:hypothetical protein LPAF129_09160 [Ligilactobacillus pabuli]|uniref:Replication initiator A N-terminal domain-containing protein n=1 Tax=Ligilactobacillus pabuli TaxID=2886039 RepID=A0ABQ5JGT9_9LACO|nr:hypothetical protein LPAF129_09160 [Ligilactobacillus pabuli]